MLRHESPASQIVQITLWGQLGRVSAPWSWSICGWRSLNGLGPIFGGEQFERRGNTPRRPGLLLIATAPDRVRQFLRDENQSWEGLFFDEVSDRPAGEADEIGTEPAPALCPSTFRLATLPTDCMRKLT